MTKTGKAYLVGGGPGDPGLLTLKGKRCLEEADLVLYDGLVNPLLLRYTRATAERTSRADSDGRRTLDQDEINQRLVEAALSGKTVVRLKGGDPFIFGRGSEEAKALADAGIPYEVVPGITAATAATEYAGISLTHRELASAVAFITGHEDPTKPESALDYAALARFPGTLVFYMGLHRLPKIVESLISAGKPAQTPTAVISRGSTPRQKTVTGSLSEIGDIVKKAGLRPPSLIVVGECVQLREQISWFESLPLAGVTVAITRPEDQQQETVDLAYRLGAYPVQVPSIEIQPIEDWSEVDATIDSVSEQDWIIFTSVNGVDALLGRVLARGLDMRIFHNNRFACIGPATAERLASYSLRADLVPEVYRGEALAEALKPHVSGRKVLWARASRGREVIPDELTAAGAEFQNLVVYKHQDTPVFDDDAVTMLERGEIDWIALSSPTIARNVISRLSALSLTHLPRLAAISPVTEAAVTESGMHVDAVASDHTWEGLFRSIAETITSDHSTD